MKVSLINYDRDAEFQLIFTKHTRLNMTPELLGEIRTWSPERINEELAYIANTIRSSHEFINYTFLIQGVSRAFTHQFVRTRTASYAQQSMRVTDQSGFEFVMPDKIAESAAARDLVDRLNDTTRSVYKALVASGIPEEDARSILPTNVSTNIVARYNLRSFADVARSRSGGRTQSEYRRVVEAMIDEVLKVHPWAEPFIFGERSPDYFNDIENFADREFGGDLRKKGELLKIVDKMRGVK